MFTLEQITAEHGKVKSGADFPVYIRAIKSLGVTHYEAYVSDGHIDYHGENNYTVTVPPKYAPLAIANTPNDAHFKAELLAHQQGKTDYLTFIQMCATAGIEKWEISLKKMVCTYFDVNGNVVLEEKIPE